MVISMVWSIISFVLKLSIMSQTVLSDPFTGDWAFSHFYVIYSAPRHASKSKRHGNLTLYNMGPLNFLTEQIQVLLSDNLQLVTWDSHIKQWTVSYRHKPTCTHQKSWLGLVESSRTDSPIPDCQAETKGWELLVLKQKRFGLLGGAPDRFIWNPRGEKTAFIFFIFHLSVCQLVKSSC